MAIAPATPLIPTLTQVSLVPDYTSDKVAIQVAWTEPANNGASISGYKLYMAQSPREYALIYDGTSRSDILTYTVTNGITKSEYYNFYIVAMNGIG